MADNLQALQTPPNILLIVADDLGFSDMGAFGGEIATPHLDALAMAGTRFTSFHSAPACSPTRAMLMTGTDPHIAGIGTMLEVAAPDFGGAPGYEGYLNRRVVTVSELLQAAGWHTIQSGKWHLGDTPESRPDGRGFTRSFSLLPAGSSHYAGVGSDDFSTVETVYREDGELVTALPADFYSSDYYGHRMVEFLDERPHDRPFFAYLPFTAPHWPLHAPPEAILPYRGRYEAGPEALRAERLAAMAELGLCADDVRAHPFVGGRGWAELTPGERAWSARTMEVYAGMVSRLDVAIGRVIAALDASGDLADTIVMFLSDNGAEGAMVEAMPIVGKLIADQIAQHFDNSLDNLGNATRLLLVWAALGAGGDGAIAAAQGVYRARRHSRAVLPHSGPGVRGRRADQSRLYHRDGRASHDSRLLPAWPIRKRGRAMQWPRSRAAR